MVATARPVAFATCARAAEHLPAGARRAPQGGRPAAPLPHGLLSHPRSSCSGGRADHCTLARQVPLPSRPQRAVVLLILACSSKNRRCFCFSECAFRTGPVLTKQSRRRNTPGRGRGCAVALGFWVKSRRWVRDLECFSESEGGRVW